MWQKLKRKLLFSIGLSAVVFLALSLYADWDDLRLALAHFDWIYLPGALFLALVNYGVRFWRWAYYLRVLHIDLPHRESLVVFLAGLILSVTPGKAGELLKAYFIKERLQTPISQSVPAVLCERVTDVIALIFLSLIGVSIFNVGLVPLLMVGAVMFLGLIVLGIPRVVLPCIGLLEKLPIVHRFYDFARRGYDSLLQLIVFPALWRGVGLALVAWFAECLGFYYVIKGFGAKTVDVLSATFIYCFATLFGAATMMPGGLGSTEGSMVGLLLYVGVLRPEAVGATLVIRLCTLWFAVAIGAYVLLRYRRYFEWEMEPEQASSVLETDATS